MGQGIQLVHLFLDFQIWALQDNGHKIISQEKKDPSHSQQTTGTQGKIGNWKNEDKGVPTLKEAQSGWQDL